MNYMAVHIQVSDPQMQDLLIGELSREGFEGFEQQEEELCAYVPEKDYPEAALRQILSGHQLAWRATSIAPQNWNAVWESSFSPVVIEDFCAIRAAFHAPVENVQHEIVITPKMSFGTGHHSTTFTMVLAMKGIDFKGKKVLDFGTGTGILAVLAEQLGASTVFAIDNDPWAVENALENVRENHAAKVQVSLEDKIPEDRYEVILANINRHIILENLPAMAKALQPDGILLLSGILEADEDMILAAADSHSLQFSKRFPQNGWLTLQMRKS